MEDNGRNRIKTFDCFADHNTLGLRWKRWLTAFKLFADGKGLILNEEDTTNRQRRALMLHLADTDVQDIFATLSETGHVKDYGPAGNSTRACMEFHLNSALTLSCWRWSTDQDPSHALASRDFKFKFKFKFKYAGWTRKTLIPCQGLSITTRSAANTH